MDATRFTVNYVPYTGDIEILVDFVKDIDNGKYECKAVNMYGDDETFMKLIVTDVPGIDRTPHTSHPETYKTLDYPEAPIFDPTYGIYDPDKEKEVQPPKVVIPLEDTEINELQPLVLTCKIIGNPKPKVEFDSFLNLIVIITNKVHLNLLVIILLLFDLDYLV